MVLYGRRLTFPEFNWVFERLYGPGIESRWGRNFPLVQTGPGAHPPSCTMGTGSFRGVKCGRGVLLTTDRLLAPRSWKSRAVHLTPPQGHNWAYNGVTLLYLNDFKNVVVVCYFRPQILKPAISKTRQACTYNVTLWRVRATVVEVEEQ
jgi:hypothetical protein